MLIRSTRLTAIANAVRNRFYGSALNLRFDNTSELDQRVTFSRTSNATQFDSAGNLVYAPHNLLTFSESFDSSVWSKTAGTVTANVGVAPDGTTTADQIASTGAGVFRSGITVTQGVLHTASVYAKAVSGGGVFSFGFDANPANGRASFDLSTGVVSSLGANVVAATAEALPNGWYRCVVSAITTSTTCILVYYNATSGANWLIWGAQLNIGTLQPYYPTTVKNLLGFAQEFDNAAWPKSNSFVQTNLLTFSEQFDNAAWTLTGTTATANAATAPNGSVTADRLTSGGTQAQAVQAATITSGATVTGSCYFKNDGIPLIEIVLLAGNNTTPYGRATFNVSTGIISTAASTANGGTNASAAITDAGNGWYRCSVTVTYPATTSAGMRINGAAATGSVLVWGAQLVQGSVPGDYQRTDATARAVMYPAPDGSVTGDKLVENTAAGEHYIEQYPIVIIGTPYLFSVYAKAGERTNIYLRTAITFADQFTHFNLSNGTITSSTHGSGNSGTVAIGNGWYRCWVRATATSSGASVCRFQMWNGSAVYTGDGTSGIYIWGAQLSDSASLDPYVYNPVAAPTAAAYYGPRFDYDPATLAARGLLIEEQRTNSIRNNTMQGAVAPGTFPTNWQNVAIAGLTNTIVGTGVENGVTYLDVRVSGTPAVSSFYNLVPDILVAGASGQTWSGSFWAKFIAGSFTNTAPSLEIRESDAAQGFLTNTILSLPLGNTLTRYSATRTLTNASTAFVSVRFIWQVTNGLPVDFTFRIGLPQLELGAFTTSVIPTTTAAATRTADTATMVGANFSNWCNQNEGTLFADLSNFTRIAATFPRLVSLVGTDANADEISIYTRGLGVNAGQAFGSITAAGVNTFDPGIVSSAVDTWKAAIAYRTNDAAFGVSGQVSATDTAVTLPVTVAMRICGAVRFQPMPSAWVRQITYFPRRLANSELQTVTL